MWGARGRFRADNWPFMISICERLNQLFSPAFLEEISFGRGVWFLKGVYEQHGSTYHTWKPKFHHAPAF